MTSGDLKKYRLGAYVSLCLLTGMRPEEARALTWEHVDLDGQPDGIPPVPPSVAVWRSVRQHGDTKARKSRRTLALPQASVDALRAHSELHAADQLAAASAWHDHDLVFCTRAGTPLDAANIRRQFRDITSAAGLGREWTPQELRLTFVSLLSASGTPMGRHLISIVPPGQIKASGWGQFKSNRPSHRELLRYADRLPGETLPLPRAP